MQQADTAGPEAHRDSAGKEDAEMSKNRVQSGGLRPGAEGWSLFHLVAPRSHLGPVAKHGRRFALFRT